MQKLNVCTQAEANCIFDKYLDLQAIEPNLQLDELAARLGISEAELLATAVGKGVIRLEEDSIHDIFTVLPEVGRVMVLTANSACLHGKKGWFEGVLLGKTLGEVVNGAIDLRLYLDHFKYAFVVQNNICSEPESIQFFDANGEAVHKIYKINQTNQKMWDRLINTFAALDQNPYVFVDTSEDKLIGQLPDNNIDVHALRRSWCQDCAHVHQINSLLKRHNVSRVQSLRLLGSKFAQKADNCTAELLLTRVSKTGLPLMIITESSGLAQIHSGPVHNVCKEGYWLKILDEDFNLHLRYDLIAETWVVRKSTMNGLVTSIEMYDKNGLQIVRFYGQSIPGRPEIKAWRQLADSMAIPSAMAA